MYAKPNPKKLRWERLQRERDRRLAASTEEHELFLTDQERELRRSKRYDRERRQQRRLAAAR